MTSTITSLRPPPGRLWGILSLVVVALPLPFLFTLNVLSLVVRTGVGVGGEAVPYTFIAVLGLVLFPFFFTLAVVFAGLAVSRPRRAGKVMGWITISIVILAIPAAWFGYLVWISPT
jgi:hypothetical protein